MADLIFADRAAREAITATQQAITLIRQGEPREALPVLDEAVAHLERATAAARRALDNLKARVRVP